MFRPRPCDVGSVHIALTVDDIDAILAQAAPTGWEAADEAPKGASPARCGEISRRVR